MLFKVVNGVSPANRTKRVNTLRDTTYSNCELQQLVKIIELPKEIILACLN